MMMQTLPWSKAPLGRGDGFDLYNKLFYDMMCKTRNVMNVKKGTVLENYRKHLGGEVVEVSVFSRRKS